MSYYLTCILFMKGSHLCEEELKTKSGTVTSLLFMYLSDWYSPLLSWYGNELVLLECCLQNNTGCLTVVFLCCQNKNWIAATFVTENKIRESIVEALEIIKSWNPELRPCYGMTDYIEEISATEKVFPGMKSIPF